MAKWEGWVAAIGGALALVSQYVVPMGPWGIPAGAVIAIVFGIWAALAA